MAGGSQPSRKPRAPSPARSPKSPRSHPRLCLVCKKQPLPEEKIKSELQGDTANPARYVFVNSNTLFTPRPFETSVAAALHVGSCETSSSMGYKMGATLKRLGIKSPKVFKRKGAEAHC